MLVRELLRRSNIQEADQCLEFADIVIDLDAHKVTRSGAHIELSPTCFKILEVLMKRPGHVYSREKMLNQVWGGDVFVEPRTVDVHIRRLRKALNCHGGMDLIRTVRGTGYSLDE